MASEIFGRQRECRFYTTGCGNKMVVSVTGPRAANELGGPVITGTISVRNPNSTITLTYPDSYPLIVNPVFLRKELL